VTENTKTQNQTIPTLMLNPIPYLIPISLTLIICR